MLRMKYGLPPRDHEGGAATDESAELSLKPSTAPQIARRMHLTTSRVRIILSGAMKKLRERSNWLQLDDHSI